MSTTVRVLSDEQVARVHERSFAVLARVGVRVDSARARGLLAEVGCDVDPATHVVRFPRRVVEDALAAAPRRFTLGGRRPGWGHPVNAGACTLVADGGAVSVWDAEAGVRRDPVAGDWLTATRLIDAIDDVGVYWEVVEPGRTRDTAADAVRDWIGAYREFSRHVQDAALDAEQARWLIEVLQVVFGDREAIRARRPFSFLLCPHSPLVLEGRYTDAYLAMAGWGIPVVAMPMPLMGLSSPVGLLSTVILGNCEVLATLCLVQAAERGAPFIYAPALAVMEPRTGRYGGGGPEHALLGAAATEMARSYGLPVEASAGGTDHHVPGIQAAYERALNWSLPALAWPDILVGPGLLGGATMLSLEQVVLDVEVFRRCRRLSEGIGDGPGGAADRIVEILAAAGPGGTFIAEPDTRAASRSGEWYVGRLGVHDGFERWDDAGRPDLLAEARQRIASLLAAREPLPFDDVTERELRRLEVRAGRDAKRSSAGSPGEGRDMKRASAVPPGRGAT